MDCTVTVLKGFKLDHIPVDIQSKLESDLVEKLISGLGFSSFTECLELDLVVFLDFELL